MYNEIDGKQRHASDGILGINLPETRNDRRHEITALNNINIVD